MRPPRRNRKSTRISQYLSTLINQRPRRLREAKIKTDLQPQATERRSDRRGYGRAGLGAGALAKSQGGESDVEEVKLVVGVAYETRGGYVDEGISYQVRRRGGGVDSGYDGKGVRGGGETEAGEEEGCGLREEGEAFGGTGGYVVGGFGEEKCLEVSQREFMELLGLCGSSSGSGRRELV